MKDTEFKLLNPAIYRLQKLLTTRSYISTNPSEQIEIESKWVSKIQMIIEHGYHSVLKSFKLRLELD
jgi:hypothetical protein